MLGALQAGLLGVSGVVGDPSLLFRNSEVGVWFEPRLSTLYQDSAGTTAVTTTGQPVGKWLDLSGNGKHATQSSSNYRPTYEVDAQGVPYLRFDGSNDFMTFATLGAGLLRSVWIVGYLRNTDTSVILLESSVNYNNYSGGFIIDREFGSPASLSVSQKSTVYNIAYSENQPISTNKTYRIEMDRQSSSNYTTQRKMWANSVLLTLTDIIGNTADLQTITFYDGSHYLGARSGGITPAQLNLYGLVLVNKIHSDPVKSAVDRYWMEKTT